MDLGAGILHVAPLPAGLEVLPPAPVLHLPGQQEVAGLGDLRTGSPAETSESRDTVRLGGSRAPAPRARAPQGHGEGEGWGGTGPAHRGEQATDTGRGEKVRCWAAAGGLQTRAARTPAPLAPGPPFPSAQPCGRPGPGHGS